MKTLILLPLALWCTSAFAYLDPGTGSMLLQVALGGVAAIAVAVKLYWYKILKIFGINKELPDENPEDNLDDHPAE